MMEDGNDTRPLVKREADAGGHTVRNVLVACLIGAILLLIGIAAFSLH
jgi:hypothetical protein